MDKSIFRVIIIILSCQTSLANITDPTRPSGEVFNSIKSKKNINQSKQVLSAIFIKNNVKKAIINSRLYKKGDIYNGKKIISIQNNKVVLESNSKTSELLLIKSIKKTSHKKKLL